MNTLRAIDLRVWAACLGAMADLGCWIAAEKRIAPRSMASVFSGRMPQLTAPHAGGFRVVSSVGWLRASAEEPVR